MGDQKPEWICLGLGVGRRFEWLIVEGSNDETKGFCNSILSTTHSQNTLNSASAVVADGTFGSRHLSDLGYVFTTLADTGCSLSTGDDSSDVYPFRLILGREIW